MSKIIKGSCKCVAIPGQSEIEVQAGKKIPPSEKIEGKDVCTQCNRVQRYPFAL